MKLRHRQRGFVGSGGNGDDGVPMVELHISRRGWFGRRYALTCTTGLSGVVLTYETVMRPSRMFRRFILDTMMRALNTHTGAIMPPPKPHRCRIGDES